MYLIDRGIVITGTHTRRVAVVPSTARAPKHRHEATNNGAYVPRKCLRRVAMEPALRAALHALAELDIRNSDRERKQERDVTIILAAPSQSVRGTDNNIFLAIVQKHGEWLHCLVIDHLLAATSRVGKVAERIRGLD